MYKSSNIVPKEWGKLTKKRGNVFFKLEKHRKILDIHIKNDIINYAYSLVEYELNLKGGIENEF